MAASSSNPAAESQAPGRSLRAALSSGLEILGTVVSSPDPVLAERLAQTFDLLWIDLEHSALGLCETQILAIASRSGGAYTVVRLPRHDSELLPAVLDMGVDGVVAPKISSRGEAEGLASALQYPPAGSRGYAPRRASVELRRDDGAPVSEVVCMLQVETRAALDELEAIASVPGVDALVVGPNDLALDLGLGLELDSSDLAGAVARVGQTASRHDVCWGVAVSAIPDWLAEARRDGAGLIVFGSDLGLYSDAAAVAVGRLRPPEPSA
jgi:2-keto-3-deoxy-L-rhamnonate aldolase RhmA